MMEGATQLEPSWNTSNPQKVISKGGWVGITGTKLSVLYIIYIIFIYYILLYIYILESRNILFINDWRLQQ